MENPKGPTPEEVIAKIRQESPEDAFQETIAWSIEQVKSAQH
jgi:hypothetical protein